MGTTTRREPERCSVTTSGEAAWGHRSRRSTRTASAAADRGSVIRMAVTAIAALCAAANWHKSSFSGGENGGCVEVGLAGPMSASGTPNLARPARSSSPLAAHGGVPARGRQRRVRARLTQARPEASLNGDEAVAVNADEPTNLDRVVETRHWRQQQRCRVMIPTLRRSPGAQMAARSAVDSGGSPAAVRRTFTPLSVGHNRRGLNEAMDCVPNACGRRRSTATRSCRWARSAGLAWPAAAALIMSGR